MKTLLFILIIIMIMILKYCHISHLKKIKRENEFIKNAEILKEQMISEDNRNKIKNGINSGISYSAAYSNYLNNKEEDK